jgi:hypothetical protein
MHLGAGISGFHCFSTGFFALVGAPSMVRRPFSLINRRELTRLCVPRSLRRRRLASSIVSIMRTMRGCGFGDPAFDSMREGSADWDANRLLRCHRHNRESIGTNQKYLTETITCREPSITNACYLCNTLRKRGGGSPFEAVPLLRVQESSVIVITRRRGASRGRPVLGGSLKSTHATRSR